MKSVFEVLDDTDVLLVKHSGIASLEGFMKVDSELGSSLEKAGRPLDGFVDISELDFTDFSFGEISTLFESLQSMSHTVKGTRMAIVTGKLDLESILKVSIFSKHESLLDMRIKSFESAEDAIKWLAPSTSSIQAIGRFFGYKREVLDAVLT